MTQYSWSLWDSLKAVRTSQYDLLSVISTVTATTAMTDKEMLARIEKAVGQLEASINHVNELNQRQIQKLQVGTATDIAALGNRFREMEEGVVRYRDNLMREFHDLAGDVRVMSGRVDRLEHAPHAERSEHQNWHLNQMKGHPKDLVPADVFCKRVPAVLWKDIKDCLRGRMFVARGDEDMDNDDEVCSILNRIEEWGL